MSNKKMAVSFSNEEISNMALKEYERIFLVDSEYINIAVNSEDKRGLNMAVKNIDIEMYLEREMRIFSESFNRRHTEAGRMKERVDFNFLNVLNRNNLKMAVKMKEVLRELKNSSILNGFEVEDYLDEMNIIYIVLKDEVLEMTFNDKDILFEKRERNKDDVNTNKEIKDFQKIIKSLVK